MGALRELAVSQGVQLSYFDAAGQQQHASSDTLLGVLRAMGIEIRDNGDFRHALHRIRNEQGQRVIEPVVTAWQGKTTGVRLVLPERAKIRKIACQLTREDGQVLEWMDRPAQDPRRNKANGDDSITRSIVLPKLPPGYHHLRVEAGKSSVQSLVIAAPERSYVGRNLEKQLGLFLPIYALRSKQNWGAGNFSDWRRLTDWVASAGGDVVASLPLLTAFLDGPTFEPGPYSPASRLFWNEFYIDVLAVPELAGCARAREHVASASFQKRIRALRRAGQVNYAEAMKARREVLELLAVSLLATDSPRRKSFEVFQRQRPEVGDYAAFRAACERFGCSWHSWPDRPKNGRLLPRDYDGAVARYHQYVQWLAQDQLDQVLENGRKRKVSLYLDLPLGVNPDSFDLWRQREYFASGASVGAPPDPFFSKGQDWGFAPLHPGRLRELGFGYVREFVRFQMQHTELLRIDHVMGLHRLYWVPRGLSASQGAYVTYPAEELYALLSLESHRHKTRLVGENLGTVPPEVNSGMKRHGLRTMYVVQYAQRPSVADALATPPAHAVASVNTHDMPTFAAHWQGLDIVDRSRLGLIPKRAVAKQQWSRKALNAALVQFLRRNGCLPRGRTSRLPGPAAALEAVLRWLASSPADMVLVNLEDLWLEERPQNVPGTSSERPNWKRKARLSLEQIESNREFHKLLRELTLLRKERRRFRDA
jgi:4-alpha-glucanotransferase